MNGNQATIRKVLGDRQHVAQTRWAHNSFACLSQALQNQRGVKPCGHWVAVMCVQATRTCLIPCLREGSITDTFLKQEPSSSSFPIPPKKWCPHHQPEQPALGQGADLGKTSLNAKASSNLHFSFFPHPIPKPNPDTLGKKSSSGLPAPTLSPPETGGIPSSSSRLVVTSSQGPFGDASIAVSCLWPCLVSSTPPCSPSGSSRFSLCPLLLLQEPQLCSPNLPPPGPRLHIPPQLFRALSCSLFPTALIQLQPLQIFQLGFELFGGICI